jgi:hypothetical protein
MIFRSALAQSIHVIDQAARGSADPRRPRTRVDWQICYRIALFDQSIVVPEIGDGLSRPASAARSPPQEALAEPPALRSGLSRNRD